MLLYSILFILASILYLFVSGILLNISAYILFPFWIPSISVKYIFAFSVAYFFLLTMKIGFSK